VADRRPDQTGSYRSALAEELIVPGKPEESLLWKRMQGRRFMKRRMPPIATELVDPRGSELIARWISELPSRGER
jgi:hypothetical protein